jgi:hypothetical protein
MIMMMVVLVLEEREEEKRGRGTCMSPPLPRWVEEKGENKRICGREGRMRVLVGMRGGMGRWVLGQWQRRWRKSLCSL